MTGRRTPLREFLAESACNITVTLLVVVGLAAASAIYGGPA